MTNTKLFFISSKETQDIEFFLPETNEYHCFSLTSKEFIFKNNKLVNEENKIPIIVTAIPNTKLSEFSCKRYFISRIIERIKLHLIRKYEYFFSIKTVKKLDLIIVKTLDVFDSNDYTYQLKGKLTVEYTNKNKIYLETFNFSELSLLGEITLENASTLPPNYFNIIKYQVSIPKNTLFWFYDNVISFNINTINYKFDIETKELMN